MPLSPASALDLARLEDEVLSPRGAQRQLLPGEPGALALSGGLEPAPIAFLSSFPPRECGIASFTADLAEAVDQARPGQPPCQVIAINASGQSLRYGPRVRWTIACDQLASYWQAAEAINCSPVQLVSIQHEYGLFGGEHGEDVLAFAQALKKPMVLTLHTVLERPSPALRRVTEALAATASAIVILARRARQILAEGYPGIVLEKVRFIPHGTPAVAYQATAPFKQALGLGGRTVLSTFGLLGPDKGIEDALTALPEVVKEHPDVLYLVLGETHPEVRRKSGETYRAQLEALVRELGLQPYVRFENRYLSQAELLRYLQATDVYVIPYHNPLQIASGTLSYALACGKAIVSTPFVYAQELLGEGRGILARFHDSASLAAGIKLLLAEPAVRRHIEQAAYAYGRRMHWPEVGRAYSHLFQQVIQQDRQQERRQTRAARDDVCLAREYAVAPAHFRISS